MSLVVIVGLFAAVGLEFAASASINNINPNILNSSTTVIGAWPTSNSLNQHLTNTVKLSNSPLATLHPKIDTSFAVPSNPWSNGTDANDADLKTDSSTWYRYNRYNYYPYYRPPYYPYYWPQDNRYNHPPYYHRYPPYNYFGTYYTGNYYSNPYRPYRLYRPFHTSYRPHPYRRPYPSYIY